MEFLEGNTVGIDLGTTFSTLAHLDGEGNPVAVANEDDEFETPSIILLADRGTMTLSIMALELAGGGMGDYEKASIISIILMFLTVGIAIVARRYGLGLGVRR